MLKFDEARKCLEKLDASEMKSEGILEKNHFQSAILQSWDLFRNEIGLPSAFLIGDEVNPHSSTQDAIDILAYEPDTSSLVVIELKRDKHKLHLLQALSYAGMMSTWDADTIISKINPRWNPDPQELIDLVNSSELSTDIKIVLIAEYYDPEVILTANWLSGTYSVDITAFAVSLHKMGDQTFISLDQRYPLKDLADSYEERRRRKDRKRPKQDVTWDDVLPTLEYPFAQRGIQLCSRIRSGEPARRRFGSLRCNYDGFTWISINFRRKYINVYLKGDFEGAQERLQSYFKDEITINTWRDGFSFIVETESQFEDLVKWLKLEN